MLAACRYVVKHRILFWIDEIRRHLHADEMRLSLPPVSDQQDSPTTGVLPMRTENPSTIGHFLANAGKFANKR